ncbi:hypothetical protein [Nocardia jiangsuensis]|uniref:Prevent-host-death family protein n=1 Tax=Nocardia jiangsuensis TaxID=1691563 RepID=A0ABV8DW36_9NOCA
MTMFQVSDLAGARRREFLDEAKQDSASLRDTDGSVLVMLAARRVAALREAASVATLLFAVEAVLARTDKPTPVELGGLAWLAEFDTDDRAEALSEIRNAVALTVASEDPAPLREVLHAWAATASVMRDPARRAIHTAPADELEFSEVEAPRPGNDG